MASLRDLGLSEYEARVYRALLRTGPATAKELSRVSEVPMGRIYDVLNGMKADDIVRTQAASRPQRYVAVEPETALDRLVEAREQELRDRAEGYRAVAEELAEDLPVTDVPEPDARAVAVGPAETRDLVADRLGATSSVRLAVAADPLPGFDAATMGAVTIDALESALEGGAKVRALVASDLSQGAPPDLKDRWIDALGHDRFRLRTSDAVERTVGVVDRTEVWVPVLGPAVTGDALGAISISDSALAEAVGEEFERLWAAAERPD